MSGNSTLRKQLNGLYEPRLKEMLTVLGVKRLELMEQARVATPGSDKQTALYGRATEIWKCMQKANLASAKLIETRIDALGDAWADLTNELRSAQTRLVAPLSFGFPVAPPAPTANMAKTGGMAPPSPTSQVAPPRPGLAANASAAASTA